jgi:hypothetical protein
MKKQDNRPQWLIDAENEIKNFENTKFGKMTDKEFRLSERQSNAGKSGIKIITDDHRRSAWNSFVESENFKESCSKGGVTQGNKSVESGQLERMRKTAQENRYNRTIESYKKYLEQFDIEFTGSQFWGGDATKAFKGNALKHLLNLNIITKLARNQYKKL